MRAFTLLFALAWCVPASLADTVRLHPQAVVVGQSMITLGDVAALEGDAVRALRGVVVGRFPAGAREVVVAIDTVRHHLDAAAVNLSLLSIKGARSCRVAAAGDRQPAVRPVPVPVVFAEPQPQPQTRTHEPVQSAVSVASVRDVVPTLAQRVTERLALLAGADPAALAVTFRGDTTAAAWLNTPASLRDVEIVLESRTGLGRVPVRVRRFAPDGQVQEARLTVDVVQREDAVVVTAPIRRGERFTAQNVAVQLTELSRGQSPPVADLDAVLGRAASVTLRVGTAVVERHLAPDVLIKRGDLVTVTVHRGRLRIRTVGRAAENGERGAIVALRNETTRERFYATVIGPRRAVIHDGDSSL